MRAGKRQVGAAFSRPHAHITNYHHLATDVNVNVPCLSLSYLLTGLSSSYSSFSLTCRETCIVLLRRMRGKGTLAY